MNRDHLDFISGAYPGVAGLTSQIWDLWEVARELPFAPFREPVSILERGEKGANTVINLDSDYVSSWRNHIAYSMRARLMTFESAVLAEMARGRLLSAQVLIRAHLEAAGMAALCLEALNTARVASSWTGIRELIPKTLFGTALYNTANKNERFAELLSLAEQRTITICSAIDALDRFSFQERATGELAWVYGLLCEAAHPNQRGTHGFATSQTLDERTEYGWEVRYTAEESVDPLLVQRLLETLLVSMRGGYAASELLRAMRIVQQDGEPVCLGVPEEAARVIWTNLLQRASDAGAT